MPEDSSSQPDAARPGTVVGEDVPSGDVQASGRLEPAWEAIERHADRILLAGALVAANLVIVEFVGTMVGMGAARAVLVIGLAVALFALLHRAVVRMARGALRTARRESRTARDLLDAVEQFASEPAGTRGTLEALNGAATTSGLEVYTWQPLASSLWSARTGRSIQLDPPATRRLLQAMAERGPVLVDGADAATCPVPEEVLAEGSSRQLVLAPMWSGTELLGVVLRRRRDRRGLRRAEDLALVSGFAAVGAVALGKATVVDRERQRARDNELLLRSVHAASEHRERDRLGHHAAQAAQALDAERAAVFSLQGGRLRLAGAWGIERIATTGCGTLRADGGLALRASSGEPLAIDCADLDEPSSLVLRRLGLCDDVVVQALRDRDGLLGLLVIDAEHAVLEAGQAALLAALARQASSAIEHTRMLRSIRKRSRHLACTPKLARCLVGLRDPDAVARTAAQELHDGFGFGHVAIALRGLDADLPDAASAARSDAAATLRIDGRLDGTGLRLAACLGAGADGSPGREAGSPDGCPDDPRMAAVLGECAATARPFVSVGRGGADGLDVPGGRIAVPICGADRRVLGVVSVAEGDAEALGEDDLHMLETIADQLAGTLEQAELIERLEQSYFKTVEALSAALEAKDAYTLDHARSITEMTAAVGRHLGMREEEVRDLRLGALLHDIGKIGVPTEILSKNGPLDDDEFELMKQHTVIGEQIIAPVEFLQGVRPMVLHEHERWDGAGYPHGLEGEEIPLGARIIFVCDAWHAMTSTRPYRRALPVAEALRRLRDGAGTQFDPQVVEAFCLLRERSGGTGAFAPTEEPVPAAAGGQPALH